MSILGNETSPVSVDVADDHESAVKRKVAAMEDAAGVPRMPETAPELPDAPEDPVVIGLSPDGREALVRMPDGRDYRLKHPGARQYMQWRDRGIRIKKQSIELESEHIAEMFFSNCVTPEGHSYKPTLDNIAPRMIGHWDLIRQRFLAGDLAEGSTEEQQ